MQSDAPIICIGEAMIEISLNGAIPGRAGVGFAGDTYNTAIYLKRAAPERRVAYATKIGCDPLSDALRARLRAEGLDDALVMTSPDRLPGLYAISTDANGERSFLYWRDNSAARDLFRAPALSLSALGQAGLLYFSAISLAILPPEDRRALLDWLPGYRAQGGLVAFDSNYRPALWQDRDTARAVIEAAWRQTDIGFPGCDDECALFDDADAAQVTARLNALGVRAGALKCGAAGPLALDGSPVGGFAPASRVIDSTAAGDSFNAAYLAAHLAGADTATCLRKGHELALRVIDHHGAILPGGRS